MTINFVIRVIHLEKFIFSFTNDKIQFQLH
jgi:hypothetical protein